MYTVQSGKWRINSRKFTYSKWLEGLCGCVFSTISLSYRTNNMGLCNHSEYSYASLLFFDHNVAAIKVFLHNSESLCRYSVFVNIQMCQLADAVYKQHTPTKKNCAHYCTKLISKLLTTWNVETMHNFVDVFYLFAFFQSQPIRLLSHIKTDLLHLRV